MVLYGLGCVKSLQSVSVFILSFLFSLFSNSFLSSIYLNILAMFYRIDPSPLHFNSDDVNGLVLSFLLSGQTNVIISLLASLVV